MSVKNDLMMGAVAGLVATGPMTLSMAFMRRWLPWWQKAPLPPHQVTTNALTATGLERLDENYHQEATLVGHFGYGAVTGTLYPVIHQLPLPTPVKSVLYGLGVWAVSYLGWIPAVGLLRPATERPMHRNLLMIVAHIVWGATTGLLFKQWSRQ